MQSVVNLTLIDSNTSKVTTFAWFNTLSLLRKKNFQTCEALLGRPSIHTLGVLKELLFEKSQANRLLNLSLTCLSFVVLLCVLRIVSWFRGFVLCFVCRNLNDLYMSSIVRERSKSICYMEVDDFPKI